MDETEFKPVPDSTGALSPAFSPDGAWVAFFAGGKLRKAPLNGGAVQVVCDAGIGPGGLSWDDPDFIVFSQAPQGIWKIPASGGTAVLVAKPDSRQHQAAFLYPQLLPNQSVLFSIITDSITSMDDAVLAVRTGRDTRVVLSGGGSGRYLPTGHLVYGRNKSLMAAPFAAAQTKVTGESVPVVEGVETWPNSGAAQFSSSDTGTLVYAAAFEPKYSLVSLTRHGAMETLATYSSNFNGISLSPDGRMVALGLVKANNDIHLYDVQRGITSRFTFEGGDKDAPVWTPDGKRIVYMLIRADATTLVSKAIDSRAEPEPLLPPGNMKSPTSVSPDGKTLAYVESDPATGQDIWTLSLTGSPAPKPFLRTRFSEGDAVFSPDGHWLAYTSNESGANQVYAARFPDGGGRFQISTDGGAEPQWAPTGGSCCTARPTHGFGCGRKPSRFSTWDGRRCCSRRRSARGTRLPARRAFLRDERSARSSRGGGSMWCSTGLRI